MKKWILLSVLIVLAVYLSGPKPGKQQMNPEIVLPDSLQSIETWINARESSLNLKQDNHARIIWADTVEKQKTAVSVVYIHGFSASYGEGAPFHEQFADSLQANLFIARLAGHGLQDPDAFKNIQAQDFIYSAKEAIEIGRRLGSRVVVLATSMGGALALQEVSRDSTGIQALLLFSPLIGFNDPTTALLNKPWGVTIASAVVGGDYYTAEANPDPESDQYWYSRYHVNGLVAVKTVQALTAKESIWKKLKTPVFVGYYHKNDQETDPTVSAPEIIRMAGLLGTPEALKQVENFPAAKAHVITSMHTSSIWTEVLAKSLTFTRKVLQMPLG